MEIQRLGGCNSCGDCCKHNDPFLGLPIQCTFYQAQGNSHCRIYIDRPDVCRSFPMEPRDTAMLKCNYQFLTEKGQKVDMYMLKSTGRHLNAAVQRRKQLAQKIV